MKNRSVPLILYFGYLLCCSKTEAKNGTKNECVNCSIYSGGCKMTTTGWAAFGQSKLDKKLVIKLPSYTDGDASLARCVIDGYAIKDEIETFICFWAPYMGCQAAASSEILNKHHMHHIVCPLCARYCGCQLKIATSAAKSVVVNISWSLFTIMFVYLMHSF